MQCLIIFSIHLATYPASIIGTQEEVANRYGWNDVFHGKYPHQAEVPWID